jgi:cellobiose dehydrogenase (acceptor)
MWSVTAIILAASALSATAAAQGHPQASTYTDRNTGISFNGYADGTGYQFGMVMPQNPSTDFIVQLVSPLTRGAGWAGIDFGQYMTGHLLVVAWPNGNKVMIAPRFATGYTQTDTIAYGGSLTLSPISKGTFVNATHVSATFVCGGCMNADSFTAANTSATFAYAYSSVAVTTPSDPSTQLSDHTTGNEPYGPFNVLMSDAESAQYVSFAAMANANTGSGSGSATSSASPSATSAVAGSHPSSTAPASAQPSSQTDSPYTSGYVIGVIAVVGIAYSLPFFFGL